MAKRSKSFHNSNATGLLYNPAFRRRRTTVHYTQIIKERELSYSFYPHFHPFATHLLNRLIQESVPGLQAADTEYRYNADGTMATFDAAYEDERKRGKRIPRCHEDFFNEIYSPNPDNLKNFVASPRPVKELDFTSHGAYAVYNWELFFHVPLTIAINLSKNGRYEEARQWFHYIFDPTDNSDGPTPERFWKVQPFQTTHIRLIEEIMINLATGEDEQLRTDTINSIMASKENPFRPHVVARYRQSAFMFKTVFAYLDNLIAWGDSDFRKDQPEEVDAALVKYVLAANILGSRPQEVPSKGNVRPQTYANLKKDLDAMGNALQPLETEIMFNMVPQPSETNHDERFNAINSLGNTLYFAVPRNEKLLSYWDTVADRLFKIRHSLNLQGIFRQLPLFAPPIDPALLAKAAAAGLDVSAVIAGLNAPLPIVRFQFLLMKAVEICQEVKSLGSNLMSVIEKEDNERLSVLRAHHEKLILSLAESVKYGQWQDSVKSTESLLVSLKNAAQRYVYFERQLGKKENEIKLPELSELASEGLINMKLIAKESTVNLRDISVDIAKDLGASGGKIISSYEAEELEKLQTARDIQDAVRFGKLAAQAIRIVPDFGIKFHFWGLGGDSKIGGSTFGDVASLGADVASAIADRISYEASNASRIGSFSRREQEWAFQSNTIAGEINQLFKQIRSAQIREAMAQIEWKNHQQQIKHASEIENFLTDDRVGKKANQAFYAWMKREVKDLYSQCFQFAYDIAKKAERALQQELGDNTVSFLQFGYTGGREGLLAGEKLHLDLKRMEMAFYERNRREYELTKHVSVMQLDPTALLALRTAGRCAIKLPEELFDMDGPGHYFRRIKSVAVSIPCIAGPYSSVNCTLTLTKSTIRKKSVLSDGAYISTNDNDERFDISFGSMQSIVTSSAQNDSGMFELNLRDERKLPFEYSGVISDWEIALPGREGEVRQFNYDTITDVIIHLHYTAREGGELLRKGAMQNLRTLINASAAAGTTRLFSVRHEFANEWEKFKISPINSDSPFAPLKLQLKEEHYPFWSKGSVNVVNEVVLYANTNKNAVTVRGTGNDPANEDTLTGDKKFGTLKAGKLSKIILPGPIGELLFFIDDNTMTDLWLTVKWGS
ncbi:insecticidal toxin protein [Flavihumibacter sp. R14]|nr:insecticidal toxin protein [Flavihumibacter soli]